MLKTELITAIEQIAPIELAESWDHCGMQIDLGKEKITSVLVAMEITKDVIAEAKEQGADFIITHHPLFFHSLHKLDREQVIGNYAIELIQNGISVYSAHTSFDTAKGGNNDYLATLLGLKEVANFPPTEAGQLSIGRMGTWLQRYTLAELCVRIDQTLGLKGELRAVGNPNQMIQKAALCTGAGADFINEAIQQGCDVLITGDLSYHGAQLAKESNFCVIDAGHYGTEKFFTENFTHQLQDIVGEKICVKESKIDLNPMFIYDILQ